MYQFYRLFTGIFEHKLKKKARNTELLHPTSRTHVTTLLVWIIEDHRCINAMLR